MWNIEWCELSEAAEKVHYPTEVVVFGMQVHMAPRILKVDRHLKPLDDELIPHACDGGDGSGGGDHIVGLEREVAGARAGVVLHDRDRAALHDHADPLQCVERLAIEPQEQGAKVWRDRLPRAIDPGSASSRQ